MAKTVAVFGATGTSGGQVARKLAEAGWSVRGITRDVGSDRANALSIMGIKVVQADMEDRDAISSAIQGVDSVYLTGPSLVDRWGTGQAIQGINVVNAALLAGVPHLVYQSALVGDARGVLSVGSKRAIEERIAETDIPARRCQSNVA